MKKSRKCKKHKTCAIEISDIEAPKMQFPESWLREFCNPPLNTEQLADTLTMGGF